MAFLSITMWSVESFFYLLIGNSFAQDMTHIVCDRYLVSVHDSRQRKFFNGFSDSLVYVAHGILSTQNRTAKCPPSQPHLAATSLCAMVAEPIRLAYALNRLAVDSIAKCPSHMWVGKLANISLYFCKD